MPKKQPNFCKTDQDHIFGSPFLGIDPNEMYLFCLSCGKTITIPTPESILKTLNQDPTLE